MREIRSAGNGDAQNARIKEKKIAALSRERAFRVRQLLPWKEIGGAVGEFLSPRRDRTN